jgi:hypothetical protein
MAEFFSNPVSWNMQQWLVASILIFILIAILALVYRLYSLINSLGKSAYKPNLRRLRPNLRPGRQQKTTDNE